MDAQGSQTNAKEDTVFLALGGALATDLSQLGTDLTPTGAGAYELNSQRAAITGATGREVYVRWFHDEDPDSTVIAHHSADLSGLTYCVCTDGSGLIFLRDSTSGVLWTAPAIGPADISVSWSTRPNPDTTGVPDALISEVIIYDHTTGVLRVLEQFTHQAPATSNTWTLTVGGAWNGVTLLRAPSSPPVAVRISERYHTNVEFSEDWVIGRSAHVTALVTPAEPLGLASALGGVGQWAGQANAGFAGAHANALRGRMLSPLVNEVYPQAKELRESGFAQPQWYTTAPDVSTYRMSIDMLRWLLCPAVEWAYVRVFVQSWLAVAGDPVPVFLRCYSMNRPHKPFNEPTLVQYSAQASLTVDHGVSGSGQWVNLGLLRLAINESADPRWRGTTTLSPAIRWDTTAPNFADSRVKIKAWQVRPVLGEP